MTQELSLVEWEMHFDGLSVEESYGIFLDLLFELINQYVPQRRPPRVGEWLVSPPRSIIREKELKWRVQPVASQAWKDSSCCGNCT